MPQTGSRHKPRVMVGFIPEVYDELASYADDKKQAVRWAAHDVILQFLVEQGRITQERADQLWRKLTRRGEGA